MSTKLTSSARQQRHRPKRDSAFSKRGVMIKRLMQLGALFLLGLCAGAASAQFATLTGTLQSSNGMPAKNYSISFTPSQFGYVAGTAVIVNTTTSCATSSDGSVVGLPNPLQAPNVSVGFGGGTLPPGNYFVKISFGDAAGNATLASPERQIQLTSTGRLIVNSPSSPPAGFIGMNIYISTSTGTESLQGQTVGAGAYIQSVPLVSGTGLPALNSTLCKQIANDAIWPSGTGYAVALTDPSGNTIPGYPMQWQLMGAGTTINLSNGLPYYHGTVYFPTPILASPLNHQLQSISGPLGLSGYNLTNVGAIGFGTSLPAWPIDVENGFINSNLGYLVNGQSGTAGQTLVSGGPSGPDTWGGPFATLAANTFTGAQTAPKWVNSGAAPTAVYGTGSGRSGTALGVVAGTQTDMLVFITTGSSPSVNGTILTVTLPTAYPTALYCVATPQGSNSEGNFVISSIGSPNQYTLTAVGTLPSSVGWAVYVHCGGN